MGNTPLQNILVALFLLSPIIIYFFYARWYRTSGRYAARLQRKRDEEVELQARRGIADQDAIDRAIERIRKEQEEEKEKEGK